MNQHAFEVNRKILERRLGALFHARTLRRELCLPVFDLNIKIWWTTRQLLQIWRSW
jgi:hypothetical protein